MQRTEYSCDRCGEVMPAERMWNLGCDRVYVKSESGNNLEDLTTNLQRNFMDRVKKRSLRRLRGQLSKLAGKNLDKMREAFGF